MIPQEPEGTNPEIPKINNESVPETTPDLERILAETNLKADYYLESWKRAQADFANYKRRLEQEKLEMGVYANTQLILAVLPILDDFERAFLAISHKHAKTDWVEGIRLVERKLKTTLEAQGLTAVQSVGETFDPNVHEAVMHVKGEDGKVVQELQKGYRLHDKIIRPSKVAVGNGELEIEKPAKAQEKEVKEE
jgi:molecular chaperone GrpE